MKFKILALVVALSLSACDTLIQIDYTLTFTTESPNEEFAKKLEEVLEETWNVEQLLQSSWTGSFSILQSLRGGFDVSMNH